MSFNNLTGPPKIVTPAGEELILPIPDTQQFMRSDWGNSSEQEVLATSVKRVSLNQSLHRFNFGYRYMPVDTAAALVRIYETHPTFTFFPRTRAASDSSAIPQPSFVCRITSSVPFVLPANGVYQITLDIEQCGVAEFGISPLILFGIEDPLNELSGTGIYGITEDLNVNNFSQILSLPDTEYPVMMYMLNSIRTLLFVKNDDRTRIYSYNLDSGQVSVWAIATATFVFSDLHINETLELIYVGWERPGFNDDRISVYDYAGNRLQILASNYDDVDGIGGSTAANMLYIWNTQFNALVEVNPNNGSIGGTILAQTGFLYFQLIYNPLENEFIAVGNLDTGIYQIQNVYNQLDPVGVTLIQSALDIGQIAYQSKGNYIYYTDLQGYRLNWDGSGFIAAKPVGGTAHGVAIYEPDGGPTVL